MPWFGTIVSANATSRQRRGRPGTGEAFRRSVRLRMDLVTFGEAMVRLTPPDFQRLEQARSFDAYVGGGELNVAVAAARMGIKSRWVSRLSDNALGRMIASAAREQGVDVLAEWT